MLMSSARLVNRLLKSVGIKFVRTTRAWPAEQAVFRNTPPWFENVVSEPGVNLLLRDLIRPGDVCFDVGAFFGDLTQVMSRLAGPRGLVCAFEANPEILPQLTVNCQANLLSNVLLTHKAVSNRSGEWVEIEVPIGAPAAAHLTNEGDGTHKDVAKHIVPTLALDDFVDEFDIRPSVVKMDIEGHELQAIRGFSRYLTDSKPHLLLEQFPDRFEAVQAVRELGYRVYCTSQYNEICTPHDFLPGATVRNIVCIHDSRILQSPFANIGLKTTVATIRKDQFTKTGPGCFEYTFNLPAGRYVVIADYTAPAKAVVVSEIIYDRAIQGKYYEQSCRFHASCRDMPFHVSKDGSATFRFYEENALLTSGVTLDSVHLLRVEGFGVSRSASLAA